MLAEAMVRVGLADAAPRVDERMELPGRFGRRQKTILICSSDYMLMHMKHECRHHASWLVRHDPTAK